ncbi:MAG: tape measure protein [Flavobacteriales bacterium]
MKKLAINVAVSAQDHLTAPFKKVAQVTQSAQKRMQSLQKQLASTQSQSKTIDSFRRLTVSARATERKFKEMQAKTAALSKAIQNTTNPSRRLQQQFKEAIAQAKRLKDSHLKEKSALEKLRHELRQAGIKTTNLGAAQRTAQYQILGLNKALDSQRNKVAVFNRLKAASGKALASVKRWGVRGLVGLTGAGYLFKRTFLDTAAEFEKFETMLVTVEGSSAKAKKAMDWIGTFATTTPYELDKVTDAYVNLKGYGIDPTSGALKILGDTASARAKDIAQAVDAIGGAVTGENERLKQFSITAKTKGDLITYTYTDKEGKQHSRTADKNDRKSIQRTVLSIFKSLYADSMVRQSKTWSGMISNVSDQWTRFMNMVMSAGVFDWLKNKLSTFLNMLNKLASSGKLQAYAEQLAGILVTIFKRLYDIGQGLWGVVSVAGRAVEFVAKMVGGFKNVGIIVGTLIVATLVAKFAALGTALIKLSRRVSQATIAASSGIRGGVAGKGGRGIFRKLGGVKGALGKLGGKAGLVGAALGAVDIGATLVGAGSTGEKAKAIAGDVGGIGGALGGAELGALLGTAILPGVGTVLGGIAGSILGGIAGSSAGSWLAGLFSSDKPATSKAAVNTPLVLKTAPASYNNQQYHFNIRQEAGENSEALANRIMVKIKEQEHIKQQGSLYDAI